jgi:hypothetical protein
MLAARPSSNWKCDRNALPGTAKRRLGKTGPQSWTSVADCTTFSDFCVSFWDVSALAFAASVTVLVWCGSISAMGGMPMPSGWLRRGVGEANGPEAGQAALDGIDSDDVSAYQPYRAVRAHLLQRLGKTAGAADAFERAIGLEEPAVRQFLLQRRG